MKALLRDVAVLFFVSYAAATLAATLAILLWTADSETIGLGLLLPLCMAPALLGYGVAFALPRWHRWRRIIFVSLAVPMPAYCLWVAIAPSAAGRADGSNLMARLSLVVMLAAGIAGFAALEWWPRTASIEEENGTGPIKRK